DRDHRGDRLRGAVSRLPAGPPAVVAAGGDRPVQRADRGADRRPDRPGPRLLPARYRRIHLLRRGVRDLAADPPAVDRGGLGVPGPGAVARGRPVAPGPAATPRL